MFMYVFMFFFYEGTAPDNCGENAKFRRANDKSSFNRLRKVVSGGSVLPLHMARPGVLHCCHGHLDKSGLNLSW